MKKKAWESFCQKQGVTGAAMLTIIARIATPHDEML